MEKAVVTNYQTLEYPALQSQKRYFSTKRSNLRQPSKSKKPNPNQKSGAYSDQATLKRGLLSINHTGSNSKEHTILYESNQTTDMLLINSNRPKLSHNRSSDKASNIRKDPINMTTLGIRKDQGFGQQAKVITAFKRKASNSMLYGNNNVEHLSPYKIQKKSPIQSSSREKTSIQFENTKKLESLIRGMLVQNDIEQVSKQDIMVKVDEQRPYANLCQDAVSLNKYLDIRIKKNDQQTNQLVYKDEPIMSSTNLFEQTILAQKQDIVALQDIEKSKLEIQKRIKERYSVLRSISSKTRSRKMNSQAAYEMLSQGRPSLSNPRGSTIRSQGQPYLKITQNNYESRKGQKRHEMSSLINPSTIDYYSGRISTILYNQNISQHSPTAMSKTANKNLSINYQDQTLNQSSNLSSKKTQRIQKKKIVIKDNQYQSSLLSANRDMTPSYIRRPLDGTKLNTNKIEMANLRPKSNGRTISQQSQLRSGSAKIRHLRNRSGQILLKSRKQAVLEDSETPSISQNQASIFHFSPQNAEQKFLSIRPDSVSLLNNGEAYEGRSVSSRYQMLQSKEFQATDRLGQTRLSQQSSSDNPHFNLRQKLNFRYIPDENHFGTINSEREQEELLQTIREDDIPNRKYTNTSIMIPIIKEQLVPKESDQQTEYIFNTPQNNNICDGVFQSSIIAANRMTLKAQWKDQTDGDSSGLSKTTMSTQRPLMSGGVNSIIGQQHHNHNLQNTNRLFSKAKIISYQKGRFSSDSSFLKMRQTTTNHKQKLTIMDGEDSECKFEENEKEEMKYERISHDQVVQIKEEEEFVEDEDSKNSNLIRALKADSEISTARIVQGTATRNIRGQSLHQEDSHCNMLASYESSMQSAQKRTNQAKNMRGIVSTPAQMVREQLHSDDEVSIRRGLEQSSFRSQIPQDPELLRQSTHSLLNRTRVAQNMQTNEDVVHQDSQYERKSAMNDEEEVEMDRYENSYDSYLKNADNFQKQ